MLQIWHWKISNFYARIVTRSQTTTSPKIGVENTIGKHIKNSEWMGQKPTPPDRDSGRGNVAGANPAPLMRVRGETANATDLKSVTRQH